MTDLDGRVIAIAGAGGGLGPVVAQRLADAGASLSLADRSQEIADGVAQDLGLPDDRVDPLAVDLLDESAANDWAAATEKRSAASTASSTSSAATAAATPSTASTSPTTSSSTTSSSAPSSSPPAPSTPP